jgi:hypothetical protein
MKTAVIIIERAIKNNIQQIKMETICIRVPNRYTEKRKGISIISEVLRKGK